VGSERMALTIRIVQLLLLRDLGRVVLIRGDLRELVQDNIARAAPTNTIDLFDHNPTKPTREGLRVAQGG